MNQLEALRRQVAEAAQRAAAPRVQKGVPVRSTVGHRLERQQTGITARQQRLRRVNAVFPLEFGTKRGERKRERIASRTKEGPVLGRKDMRWIRRYFAAQELQP